ncbi:MAG: hypothetical protein RL077_139 [Verrucomicrobiota bacterium]|jgi:hypothetical protein
MAQLPKIKLRAEIPESLKAELAPTRWGKILSITPVVMTVIATMLAGLASSEMTRAQYDRSLAAQRQSKAGDQWNFFQGKRLRAVVLRTSLDTLNFTGAAPTLDVASLRLALGDAATSLDATNGPSALAALLTGQLPSPANRTPPSLELQAALKAIETSQPDSEIADLLAKVTDARLDDALRGAQAQSLALETALQPINQTIERWEKNITTGSAAPQMRAAYIAARLNYHAQRYDLEARLNQTIAGLYELQVRTSNLAADRHHRRSSRFFFGMLAAQMGVIIATFAIAAQKRNVLWSMAALSGAVSIAFTLYVLIFI